MASTEEAQEKDSRGIPKAPFISDVEKYIVGRTVMSRVSELRNIQDALAQKARAHRRQPSQRRRGVEEKIPDIRKTLTMIEYANERRGGKKTDDLEDDLEDLNLEDDGANKKPLITTFELNETFYAEAKLEDTDANEMLSYEIPEAIELFGTKLKNAETSLQGLHDDLEFLRE